MFRLFGYRMELIIFGISLKKNNVYPENHDNPANHNVHAGNSLLSDMVVVTNVPVKISSTVCMNLYLLGTLFAQQIRFFVSLVKNK